MTASKTAQSCKDSLPHKKNYPQSQVHPCPSMKPIFPFNFYLGKQQYILQTKTVI